MKQSQNETIGKTKGQQVFKAVKDNIVKQGRSETDRPFYLAKKSLASKGRLRISDGIVQRLYNDAIK